MTVMFKGESAAADATNDMISTGLPASDFTCNYAYDACYKPQMFMHKSAMQLHADCDLSHRVTAVAAAVGRSGGAVASDCEHIKPHQCQQCLKSFSSNHQLVQHIRVHTGEKPYKCSYCQRRFKQLSHVQQHTRLHTGERPYKCHFHDCGRAFIQLSNLQQHLRNHDSQLERMKNRPFHCQICGKGFATESSLRTHTTKHATLIGGPNAVNCPLCHKMFLGGTALMEHMKHVHKDPNASGVAAKRRAPTHPCPVCGKQYVNEGSLRKHMSSHPESGALPTTLRMWPCSVCQAVFTNESSFLSHMDHMRMDPKHQFAAQYVLSRAAAERRERETFLAAAAAAANTINYSMFNGACMPSGMFAPHSHITQSVSPNNLSEAASSSLSSRISSPPNEVHTRSENIVPAANSSCDNQIRCTVISTASISTDITSPSNVSSYSVTHNHTSTHSSEFETQNLTPGGASIITVNTPISCTQQHKVNMLNRLSNMHYNEQAVLSAAAAVAAHNYQQQPSLIHPVQHSQLSLTHAYGNQHPLHGAHSFGAHLQPPGPQAGQPQSSQSGLSSASQQEQRVCSDNMRAVIQHNQAQLVKSTLTSQAGNARSLDMLRSLSGYANNESAGFINPHAHHHGGADIRMFPSEFSAFRNQINGNANHHNQMYTDHQLSSFRLQDSIYRLHQENKPPSFGFLGSS